MKAVALPLMAALAAGPALAQDPGDDWDILRDGRNRQVMAYLQFSNGLGITVRCLDGSLDAVIGGLPPPINPQPSNIGISYRALYMTFRDEREYGGRWVIATNDTMAVGLFPAPFARRLREGGALQIRVPDGAGDGRSLSYRIDLPPSAHNIDEVLTTCDRPLTDPRDEVLGLDENPILPASITWERPPRPSFPTNSKYASGFVVVSCNTRADGGLEDCIAESQHPADSKFGREALTAARRARLQVIGDADAPVPVRRVVFTVTFRMM
jgi:hypothetical protein